MAVALPSGLALRPLTGTWWQSRQPNKTTFRPEVGRLITRRRTTSAGVLVRFDMHADAATVAIFEAWYGTDLRDGVLEFDWTHPMTDVPMTWQFDPGGEPEWRAVQPDLYRTSLQLIGYT